jgi:DNA-binding transcriptional MerR regulator
MIRHYEKIGLVPAPVRRGSYRDYADADVHRLRFIANARDLDATRPLVGSQPFEQRSENACPSAR